MAVDTTHQCPRCELRFRYTTELADHLATDHDVEVDEDLPTPGGRPPEQPVEPGRRDGGRRTPSARARHAR